MSTKKILTIVVVTLLMFAAGAMADKVEVTTTAGPGTLTVDAYHYTGAGNTASNHWFQALGGFNATVLTKRNDGTTPAYDELFTGITATSTSAASFTATWFQDFDETYVWGSKNTGEVGAHASGSAGAAMNVGSSTWCRGISMDSYPAWSNVALYADGTGGSYALSSYAECVEGPGPNYQAYSALSVSGTNGQAWQSFGYNMTAGDAGNGTASHSAATLGVIPPLGSVNGTHVYVDAGGGTYTRNVHGDEYLDWEGGNFPGGGTFTTTGVFPSGGMHSTPWTTAN